MVMPAEALEHRTVWAQAADRLDPLSQLGRVERERDEAYSDIRAFARHASIQIADGPSVRFADVAWPWQPMVLLLMAMTERLVIGKARQLGVSWLAAIFALWTAMRRGGQSVLLISRRQDDADKLLAKGAFIYDRLPEWKPEAIVNARSIRFPGLGSEIEAMPATENIGRSRTANLVILDEHGHQPFARKIMLAVGAAAEFGRIISISSFNGQGTLHSQLFTKAKGGEPLLATKLPDSSLLPLRVSRDAEANGWRAVFIPFDAHPARDAAWLVKKRLELEELADADFTQEYPANDVEAIQTTGRPVFNATDVQRQVVTDGRADEPGLRIYREPVADRVYVIGADVSEGLERSDWCSAFVMDRDSGEQVAQMRGRWAPDIFATRLDRLARRYGREATARDRQPVILAVERNNHGHAVILRLVQLQAASPAPYALFRAKDKRLGWVTTTATRPVLVDQLEAALRTGALQLRDAGTVDQFQTFHWGDDGKPEAQEGSFDDDVLAAGIAWQVRRRSFGRVLGATQQQAATAA